VEKENFQRSSEILADENGKHFSEKIKLLKFSTESRKIFGNRGEI